MGVDGDPAVFSCSSGSRKGRDSDGAGGCTATAQSRQYEFSGGKQALIASAPPGTDILPCRRRDLPRRAVVTEAFIAPGLAAIPAGAESLLISTAQRLDSPISLAGSWSDNDDDLREALEDLMGDEVAVGLSPDFMAAESENLASVSEGRIDGPR